jgi:hypothetical protein
VLVGLTGESKKGDRGKKLYFFYKKACHNKNTVYLCRPVSNEELGKSKIDVCI